jgi:hypothetical protein
MSWLIEGHEETRLGEGERQKSMLSGRHMCRELGGRERGEGLWVLR